MRKSLTGLLGCIGLLVLPMSISAQPINETVCHPIPLNLTGEIEEPRETRRQTLFMTESTNNRLAKATELVDEGDALGALAIVEEMLERSRRYNELEISFVHREAAAIYNGIDRPDKVLYHYEEILKYRDVVSPTQITDVMFTLAQLYAQKEDYQTSLAYLEEWMTRKYNPGPQSFYFIAQVHFKLEDYDNAVCWMRGAMAEAEKRGRVPIREGWYNMLKFMYFEREQWDKVLEILEIMVELYPDRTVWIQLAAVFFEMGEEEKQAYAMEAARLGGYFEKETDYVQYAGITMNALAFIRAANALQEGLDAGHVEESFKVYNQLGQAYQLAKETNSAMDALLKAAKDAEDGKVDQRLARLYYDQELYDECGTTVDSAIRKGIDEPYNLLLLKGMCQFFKGDLTDARQTFREVGEQARRADDDGARSGSRTWSRYVDAELNRIAELRKLDLL